jgi:hypothetical protein
MCPFRPFASCVQGHIEAGLGLGKSALYRIEASA